MSKPLNSKSPIFTTKNDELAIFGQTIDDVKNKLINFNDVIMQGGTIASNKKQIIPEINMAKIISETDASKIVENLNKIKNGTNDAFDSFDVYFKHLDEKGQSCVRGYVKENQNQIYTTEGVIASSKAARDAQIAHNLAIKQSTIAYKAATLAKKMFSMAGNILVMMALSKAIEVVSKTINELVHSEENLQNKASELGSSVQKNADDIDSYKNKIKDLHVIINDSSSSIEDVTKARSDLMIVQDELIDKFGDEKGAIETITTAINGQSDALDDLSKKSYLSAKNKFNEKTGGDKFSDWLSFGSTDDDRIQSNMDKMVSKMRNSMYKLQTTGNEVLDNLIAKSYGLNISADMYGNGSHFNIYGDLDEIQDKLYGIQEMSLDFDVSTGFENSLTNISNDVDIALQSYKDLYDQYILYEKILNSSKDNQYDEHFDAINKAKESYDKAFSSGDDFAIQKASQDYANVLSGAMNLATENYDDDVADYFRNMYPELQEIVSVWEFNADFKINTDDIKTQVSDAVGEFDSSEDVLNFNAQTATQDQIDAYGTLTNVAEQYGMTIKQLITLLEKQKIIASDSYKQLSDKFGEENVSKLSDEDLQIAYEVSDGTIQSWDELITKIEEYKAKLKEDNEAPTFSISNTIDQLDKQLKPALDSLKSAYQNIFTDDGFTLENADTILYSIKSSIDSLNKMDGIEIDYSSFEELATILVNVNSKEEDVQAGFNNLAQTIIRATGVTDNFNNENRELAQQLLSQLGIVNAQEVVFSSLINNTEALKEAGLDLATATDAEIEAFLAESVSAEYAGQALALLQLKKLLLNGTSISTASDVEEIYNLAVMAGIGAEQLTRLAKAKDILNRVESGAFVSNEDMSFMVDVIENADDILSDYQPEVDFSGLSNSAKSAGKETGKTYKEALQDELSDLDNVISYVSSVIDNQVDLLNSQKEAAINALEEEKKAAEEALEAQKKLIQEQIDAKQKEIDAIKAAREERQSELDLQKKIYEFNRLMNQKTQFIFDGKQMVYRNDTSGARDAREEVEEAKENIKITKMEKELSSLELLIDSLDVKIDESNEYYDKLISQTESYWDAIINGLEEYKSRWEQLKEIEEQAEMEVALEKLGISTQDLLNMSDESFNSFKEKYLGILTELYSGNNEMLSAISEAASSNADSLNSYIDKTQGYLNTLGNTDLTNVTDSVKEVTDTLSSAVSGLNNTSLSNVISQFNLLQEAISAAAGSISGVSAKPTATDTAGGNPKNPNQTGGSSSLSDALQKHGDVVASVLGTESDGEIGKFNKLENTISKTAQTIGVRDIKTGEASEDTLTGSLQSHSKVAEQIIPAETELFSALEKVVGQAHDHIADIQTMLEDMDGKTFEVTLNINGGTGEALTYSTTGINKFAADEKDPSEHTQIQKGTPEKFVPLGFETALKSLKADEIADNISKWAELNSNNIIPASLKLNIPDYSSLLSNTNNRNDNSVSVGQINVTCPGVTSKEVAKQVGTALQQEFQGFALNAYQRSHKR